MTATMTFTVRSLVTHDVPAYQQLRLQGLRECPSAFVASYEEEAALRLHQVAQRLALAPGKVMLGAFDGDALVGIAGLQRESAEKLAHKADIHGVYVAPAARRHGAGRALMARLLDEARAMPGLAQVNLSVNAANEPAIALYRAFGFEPFGRERGYLVVDGQAHDELQMALQLGAAAGALNAASAAAAR